MSAGYGCFGNGFGQTHRCGQGYGYSQGCGQGRKCGQGCGQGRRCGQGLRQGLNQGYGQGCGQGHSSCCRVWGRRMCCLNQQDTSCAFERGMGSNQNSSNSQCQRKGKRNGNRGCGTQN